MHAILYFRRMFGHARRPGVWTLARWMEVRSGTFALVGTPTRKKARFTHNRYSGSIWISRMEEGVAKGVFFGGTPDMLFQAFMGWLARSGGEYVERVEVFLDAPEE